MEEVAVPWSGKEELGEIGSYREGRTTDSSCGLQYRDPAAASRPIGKEQGIQ